MKLAANRPDILVPDGCATSAALARTTHLAIGAHQDDIELCMPHGPLVCFAAAGLCFTGITCTDGAGSARSGPYAGFSDEDMKKVRQEEQRAAARVGRYNAMIQLGYSSAHIKQPDHHDLAGDLLQLLQATRPQVVYTHNPADKHATHVAVFKAALQALRSLPGKDQPRQVLGCEAWRSLDWLPERRKVLLKLDAHQNLRAALCGLYDSQIAGGKRYDTAVAGRYHANATFLESHEVDICGSCQYALDLKPLIDDQDLDPATYIRLLLAETEKDITRKLGGDYT